MSSYHDLPGLDDDETPEEENTAMRDMRIINRINDPHVQAALMQHEGHIGRHKIAIREARAEATEAHEKASAAHGMATEIKTTIATAIRTLEIVGAVIVAVGSLVAALAAAFGYALAHFTLH